MSTHVVWLRDVATEHVPLVGERLAMLGTTLRLAAQAGVRVPDGFVITADAFHAHLAAAQLDGELAKFAERAPGERERIGRLLRARIRTEPLPETVVGQVIAIYDRLVRTATGELEVVVRATAVAGDPPGRAFAGFHEDVAGIHDRVALLDAVRAAMAAVFSERALAAARSRGIALASFGVAIGVHRMVRSDNAASGVAFTRDAETGSAQFVEVAAAWGVAEPILAGRIDPRTYVIHKPLLAKGFASIIATDITDQGSKWIRGDDVTGMQEIAVPDADRRRAPIDEDEVFVLARWALAIEQHHARQTGLVVPIELEWAKDDRTGELFVMDAVVEPLPEPGLAAPHPPTVFRRLGGAEVVVMGKRVGTAVVHGLARVVHTSADLAALRDGEIAVAATLDPGGEPGHEPHAAELARAAAIITERGSRMSRVARAARMRGVPCIVGAAGATRAIATGDTITVSCAEGRTGRVYAGRVAFERDIVEGDRGVARTPKPIVPVVLELSDPDDAFVVAALPTAGVGLARIDTIVQSLGVHPLALIEPDRLSDPHDRTLIARLAADAPPSEIFVDALVSGIARIGAAFYPRPVVVQFSNLTSRAYAALVGGTDFEPREANPLLGLRGARRYCSERHGKAFALECAAIRRVRHGLGLANVRVAVPYCRTPTEAREVLAVMADAGLMRGDEALEVYMTVELPNQVALANRFADVMDGFVIVADSLAQHVLGIDRDSELELDAGGPGVRDMVAQAVEAIHRAGRPVTLCSELASRDLGYARFLVSIGIDGIAVPPGQIPALIRTLAHVSAVPSRARVVDRVVRAIRRNRLARRAR